MPTILRIGPYRFFFYSADGDEPPHVHIERNSFTAKFWIDPVRLQRSKGFRRNEINNLFHLINDNIEHLRRSWDEYFNN